MRQRLFGIVIFLNTLMFILNPAVDILPPAVPPQQE